MRFKLLLLMILSCVMAAAQVETGSVTGTVKDNSGAVVANAVVAVQNVATQASRKMSSSSSGQFAFTGLAPGNYELSVTSGNFAPYKTRLEVTVGGRLTVDPTLTVGAQTVVDVVAEGATTVNTQTQELSQVISEEQIAQLPSLTRNAYDFVGLSGNVSSGDSTGAGGRQGSGQNLTDRGVGFAINGQRASGTEILLDGVENIDFFNTLVGQQVPQDAVQEFRVLTNNFDAQYGRASGGVVNVSTKSGSNDFHGSAWEFNRLSAYTANTYDNVANGVPRGTYTRNQFGYSVGGPIIKNKLFFFESTEWLRVRSSAQLISYVPTPQFIGLAPANVQSYFQAYGGTPKITGTLSKEEVAAAAGSAAGGNFLTMVPAGTPVFGKVAYAAPSDAGGGNPQNAYQLVGRVDYQPTESTQVFVRYGLESILEFPGTQFNGPYPQYNVGDTYKNHAGLVSLSHSFTPRLMSSSKVSFTRLENVDQYDTKLQNTPTLYLSNGATINGQAVQLPGFYSNLVGVGGLPYGGPQNTFELNQDLSWSPGAHAVRVGGQFNYQQVNRSYGAYAQAIELLGGNLAQGLDNFLSGNLALFQAAVNPQGKYPCVRDPNTGSLIATAGCTLTLPVSQPAFARGYRYDDWAIYGQDSWRVNRRLTVNYGLRYEHYGVQHNSNKALDSNFYYGTGSNFFQRVRTGSVQLANNSSIGELWSPRWGTAAPRVGFAYDIFGDGKSSLRGGYGISYERNFGNVTFNMIQNPPNYASVQVRNGVPVTNNNLGPLGGANGTVLLPPSSPRNVAQDINTAQTQFWSLSLERQLGKSAVVAVEYSGAHGVHLYDIKNINMLGGGQVYLGDSFDSEAGNFSRPNQQFTSINNRGSDGYSHYNGLNLRLQTQNLWHTGLSLVSNYTWSHALDNLSSTFSDNSTGANGVGNLGYLDPRNPALDYGSSDFDIRHRFVASVIWNEPFFRSDRGWKERVLGGYSLIPMFNARSGSPFSIMDTTNSLNAAAGMGIPRYTPDGAIASYSVGGSPQSLGGNNFIGLTLPDANHWAGLLGVSDFGPYPATMTRRNAFRGPGAWNFDMAMSKKFRVREGMHLEFRAEAFNLFNHHNFFFNGFRADAANYTGPVVVELKKGGLGGAANNGNHDERRFGQFALRLNF